MDEGSSAVCSGTRLWDPNSGIPPSKVRKHERHKCDRSRFEARICRSRFHPAKEATETREGQDDRSKSNGVDLRTDGRCDVRSKVAVRRCDGACVAHPGRVPAQGVRQSGGFVREEKLVFGRCWELLLLGHPRKQWPMQASRYLPGIGRCRRVSVRRAFFKTAIQANPCMH